MSRDYEQNDDIPSEVLALIDQEPIREETKHELYLLVGSLALEYGTFEHENSWHAIFEPSPTLIVTVTRQLEPFTAFGLMEPMTGQARVIERGDVMNDRYEWDFDDTSGELTVELSYSHFRPTTRTEVEDNMKLWIKSAYEPLDPEEQVRFSFHEAESAAYQNEQVRQEQEGLTRPTE